MGLYWQWSNKCGEAVVKRGDAEITLNLYEGNAFLIFIYEFNEGGSDVYTVDGFWHDERHMKACLGLDKKGGNTRNMHDDLKKIRLNKSKCRNYKKIVAALVQALNDITIEIYTDKEV